MEHVPVKPDLPAGKGYSIEEIPEEQLEPANAPSYKLLQNGAELSRHRAYNGAVFAALDRELGE